MISLKQKFLTAAVIALVSAGGVFAQKDDKKRPPKNQDTKVVVRDKERPPQDNKNDKKQGDKKGRP